MKTFKKTNKKKEIISEKDSPKMGIKLIRCGLILLVIATVWLVICLFFYNHKKEQEAIYEKERIREATDEALWKMDECFVTVYGDYLFSSNGKKVNIIEDTIETNYSNPHYTSYKVCTDASRKRVLILTTYDELYLYNTDLEKTLISEKVEDAGMSLDGSRIFVIKEPPTGKYTRENNLYLYDLNKDICELVHFHDEDVFRGAISPNGRYFAALSLGESNKVTVWDLEDNCKHMYSFNAGDAYWNLDYPRYVSSDGKTVYCEKKVTGSNDKNPDYYINIYKNGKKQYLGNKMNYSFAVFSRDMEQMIYGQYGNTYYYSENQKKIKVIESEKNSLYFAKDYFSPNGKNPNIKVITDRDFGGFGFISDKKTIYFNNDMNCIEIFGSPRECYLSFYDDVITTFYYKSDDGLLHRSVYSAGATDSHYLEKKIEPKRVVSNENHNELYILTTDLEIYEYDGSNGNYTLVDRLDNNYDYKGLIIKYSKADHRLYYQNGASLYSYDPLSTKSALVLEDILSIDEPDDEKDLLHYHVDSYQNHYVLIGGESVKIE